jgi:hypothetical protein
MAYANEAARLAEVHAVDYRRAIAEHRAAKSKAEESGSRSTSADSGAEPASDQTSATTIE